MEAQSSKLAVSTPTSMQLVPEASAPPQEKGAIGAAFLVWLLGGGLGLAIVVFLLLKIF